MDKKDIYISKKNTDNKIYHLNNSLKNFYINNLDKEVSKNKKISSSSNKKKENKYNEIYTKDKYVKSKGGKKNKTRKIKKGRKSKRRFVS